MCDYVTNEHVVTYDPSYVDEHSDSTDFDDDWSMTLRNNHKKTPVIKRTIPEKELSVTHLQELYRKKKVQSNMPKKATVNCSTSFCHHCGNAVGNYPESPITKLDGNRPNAPRPSKVNLLKNKLSSVFFRGNRKIPVEENKTVRCKVYCADCRRRQIRKLSRRHGFPPRPVFVVDNIPTGPLSIPPDAPYRMPRESISYTTSLSSCSEQVLWKEKLYKNERRDDEFEKEFKSYLQYKREKEKRLKSRSQQYSRHDKYQVFANQNQYSQAENSSPRRDSATGFSNGLPVTASGFWEFFMNKLHARYQEAKSLTSSIGCCPPNCGNVIQASDLKRNERQNTECQTQPEPSSFERSSQRSKFNFSSASSQSRPSSLHDKTYTLLSSKKSSSPLDVGCDCNPDQINQAQRVKKLSPKSTQVLPSNSKSCQEPHEEITKALKEKYNGEVLCIHNPPCVLINGCLNVPQQLPKTPVSVWPTFTLAAREKKPSYLSCKKYKKAKSKKNEQACQYHAPYGELQQYHAFQQYDAIAKTEKLMQSICNHNPPCQVVPGCFRPKFDPQLVNSCVHVPMCRKIPECVEEQDKSTCEHKPRCFEVPECRRNWMIGRGSMHRQSPLRAGSRCRHQPPCLMVPRCLGQVISESMVPFEAIPGCMHQPPCEVIPACCRRSTAKDALSAIRPPFNKGVKIKISRMPVCQYNKLMKMIGIK